MKVVKARKVAVLLMVLVIVLGSVGAVSAAGMDRFPLTSAEAVTLDDGHLVFIADDNFLGVEVQPLFEITIDVPVLELLGLEIDEDALIQMAMSALNSESTFSRNSANLVASYQMQLDEVKAFIVENQITYLSELPAEFGEYFENGNEMLSELAESGVIAFSRCLTFCFGTQIGWIFIGNNAWRIIQCWNCGFQWTVPV